MLMLNLALVALNGMAELEGLNLDVRTKNKLMTG